MVNISMKMMLEAGVHFGHQTRRWNPKMARYIFGERNGIHILDLQKTVREAKKAYAYVKEQAQTGARFLFVGTKKQARDIIREESCRCSVACVHEKWLGGTLTNFATIRKSIQRLEELEKWETDGLFKVVSKKEVSRLTKEMNRLKKLLTGIRKLTELPQVMFIVDPMQECGAVNEARKLNIPIVAVCDTNCDPDPIHLPIPGNDDAARSIRLFCSLMADAVMEGKDAAKASEAAESEAAEQEPPETAEQKPSEAAEQEPPETAEQKPSEAVEQKPSEAVEQKPPEAAEQKPPEAVEQKPPEAAEQKPPESGKVPAAQTISDLSQADTQKNPNDRPS